MANGSAPCRSRLAQPVLSCFGTAAGSWQDESAAVRAALVTQHFFSVSLLTGFAAVLTLCLPCAHLPAS